MKKVTRYINTLNNLYAAIGNEWVDQNSLVLNYAKNSNLVIGGSIALAIGSANPYKIPGDIDLFTNTNEDALNFISYLTKYLAEKKGSFYRMDVNNETPRVLPGVLNHYRIKVPFWKPICVMTVSKPIRKYFYHGAPVQFYDDVLAAAKEASKIDNKNRLPKEEQAEEELAKLRKYLANRIQKVSIESVPTEDVQVSPMNNAPMPVAWSTLENPYIAPIVEDDRVVDMTNDEITSAQEWPRQWTIPYSSISSLAPGNIERELINTIPAVTDVPNLTSDDFQTVVQNFPTLVTIDSIPQPIAEGVRRRRNTSRIGVPHAPSIAHTPTENVPEILEHFTEQQTTPTQEFPISIPGTEAGRWWGISGNNANWTVQSNNEDNTLNATYNGAISEINMDLYTTVSIEAGSTQNLRNRRPVRVDERTFGPYIMIDVLSEIPGVTRRVDINMDYYESHISEATSILSRRDGESEEEVSRKINTIIYYTQAHVREEALLMADVIQQIVTLRGSEVIGVDSHTAEPVTRNQVSENIYININTDDPSMGQQVEISREYYDNTLNDAIGACAQRDGESEDELLLRINTWIYHSQPNIAQPRRLRANWTVDTGQDLQTMHGINRREIVDEMVQEIERDIVRELVELARERGFGDPYFHHDRTLVS